MQDYIYSVIAFLAMVIHLIINFDMLPGRKVSSMHAVRTYRVFLAGVFAYYLTDAAWGVLAGLGWTKLLYVDTAVYYIAIAVSVLTLSHFVIAYLGVKGLVARMLFWFGYALLALYFVLVAANIFNNCLFYFDAQGAYHAGPLRLLLFDPLVPFIVLVAFFSFERAIRSQDAVRRRNIVVFLFCLTMAVAIVLQILWPLWPFYAMGCLVGNCFFHVFVIEDERDEQRQAVIEHEQTMKHMAELEEALERARIAEKAMKGSVETIDKQRRQEAELRKQLEDALQSVQNADREKSAVLTDLEDASELARLASFHYDFDSRKRTGSSHILRELWPEDENGNALLEEDFVYPEDLPIFKQNMKNLFEKKNELKGSVQFSFRVGKNASDLRYYRMKLTLDPRKPNAVLGIVQDVTELAVNMLKLKDTQAMWDAAINSIPIMFTVKDMDDEFRYLLCNKAFASVFNFSPDEIVGKTDHDLFHNDTTLGFADQINSLTTGTDGLMKIEGELPDGRGNLRFITTILRVFQDARGHRLLLAAASDVTDMHMLFQNQRVVNQLLAEIIGEEDFDLSIQRTLETVGKIIGASRGSLMRHEEDGMVQCVAEYVEPTHLYANYRNLNHRFSRTGGFMRDTDANRAFICSDVRSIDWTKVAEGMHQAAIRFDLRAIFLSNIMFKGKIWGTIGFNFEGVDHTFTENEITLLRATAHVIEVVLARKHAQTLIMDSLAHAQAADKAKSFFIASVSHEIRTPLNSVIGFAELLREGNVSKEQERESLDAISSSANALLMLINDVLDLSKLEANQMQIITAFTDFNALCREVMLIFTFRAQENANKLISDVPENLPELDIDNIRIRQILINLLGNAVKFTKNGSITLQVEFTPDSDSSDTGTLRFAVSDTGIGISEEDQKKLMEPFVQLSKMRGTNAANNGTGLGLSISKRLATCMNGELTCTSKVGEGSTFEVTLNAVRYRAKAVQADKAQAKAETEAIARDVKTIRILIVDDVPMNLRVAKAIFNKIGFKNVFTAESGKEALEFLDKQPVDLILSDMWMPEMNGAQLAAEVKNNPGFAHVPIVAQTADVETSSNFDMSHFDAIILKPLTKEKLSNMVKRIIVDGDLRKGNGGAPVHLG